MNAILLVIAALSLVASLVMLAETVTPTARRRQSAVAAVRRFSRGAGARSAAPMRTVALKRAEDVGARFASQRLRDGLPQRLAAAGLAGRMTPEQFVALRAGLTAVGTVAGLALAAIWGLQGSKAGLAAVFVAGLGFMAPATVVDRRARSRRREIHDALPDALDLLAVTVEAGLGLYGAIARYVETTSGPLSDELALVLTELRVGDSSERALRRMGERLQSQEVRSLVRSLIQGEQLGLSLARTLRNLADDTRRRRRAIAEELAAKAPVKMVFPTALFIFPALFVGILGPAIVELHKFL